MRRAIQELLDDGRSGPIVCHVDLFGAANQVNAGYRRNDILRAQVDNLQIAAAERPIWLPTFNYDFPKTGKFDARTSPAQVGPFPEFFRNSVAEWRVPVPIFSFAGTGTPPSLDPAGEVDAFGKQSIFSEIVRLDGTVLFYGAGVISATILHHAESLADGPVYRYEKSFKGSIVTLSGEERQVTLRSHVRPLNRTLAYDGTRMRNDLLAARLLHVLPEEEGQISALGARDLVNFWSSRILDDPFYLLDPATRNWVEPFCKTLGRRFLISDFEGI
ncbi:MAG TPA: AAC(3) family N-acetyltransferase [Terriglobales bacterium]|nr:AAC(3) family N-acetyltransferase [Terriglobales bacterium]